MPAAINITGILETGVNPSPAVQQNSRQTIRMQRSTDMLIRWACIEPNGAPVDVTGVPLQFTMKLQPGGQTLISRIGLPPSSPAPSNRADFMLAPIDTYLLAFGRYTWDIRGKFAGKWETLNGLGAFVLEPNDGEPDQPLTAVSPVVFYFAQPPLILAFDFFGPHVFEVGDTLLVPSGFATYNRPASAAVVDDFVNPTVVLVDPFTSWAEPFNYTYTALNTQQDFTLTASETGGPNLTAIATALWQPRVYFGSSLPGVFDETFIEALSDSVLLPSPEFSPGYAAGAGEFLYYCVPSVYVLTEGEFIDAATGIAVGMSMVATGVSVTNAFGVIILYDVWQSDVAGLGPITINVAETCA